VLAVAVVAAGAVACFKDPTSSLRNGASRILLTRSSVFIPVGDSLSVQAELKDDQGNTFDMSDAAWTSSDAAVAVVAADVSRPVPFGIFSRAFIRTTGAGSAWVYIESHGIKDSVQVYGLPLTFNGTVTAATDTVTLNGSSVLTFTASGADTSVVTIGGRETWVLSRSANQMKVIAIPGANATVTISNVVLNGVVTIASLDAPAPVTVGADPTEPANDDPATPVDVALYQDYVGTLSSTDVDDFIRFTAATGDSVRIAVQWLTDSDIDSYLLDGTGGGYCTLDGCAMASSSNPETTDARLTAGTTYQVDVNLYDIGTATEPVFYRLRTTKIQ
jgi:hypothetical protein